MQQKKYICYTRQGQWYLYADSDLDAVRVCLWYCWRDNEDFIKVESTEGTHRTLRICSVDGNNAITSL